MVSSSALRRRRTSSTATGRPIVTHQLSRLRSSPTHASSVASSTRLTIPLASSTLLLPIAVSLPLLLFALLVSPRGTDAAAAAAGGAGGSGSCPPPRPPPPPTTGRAGVDPPLMNRQPGRFVAKEDDVGCGLEESKADHPRRRRDSGAATRLGSGGSGFGRVGGGGGNSGATTFLVGDKRRGGASTAATTTEVTKDTTTERRSGDDVSLEFRDAREDDGGHRPEGSTSPVSAATSSSSGRLPPEKEGEVLPIYVTKRDGTREPLDKRKILSRLERLCDGLDLRYVNVRDLTDKIAGGAYPNVTTWEIDTLASETSAALSTRHPDYGRLAGRICISQCHSSTPSTFSAAITELAGEENDEEGEGGKSFISPRIVDLVGRRGDEIEARIVHDRDMDLTYFGFKTLERAYLLKDVRSGRLIERPQYMFMRVALGIHCCGPPGERGGEEEEDRDLQAAFETYDLMSRGLFMHASPTLFHSGTTHPQLSSCFLVQMSEDSINGIYDTLKRCAVISKSAGGIGLAVHNIRARGTYIRGTRGVSNGLVPMLRVYDVTSRYVDQGGGKRPGAFAVYIEPWHADVFDVLNLKKNHGKEEHRARDLFYGLWVPDLFMRRVERDENWSLLCPHQCPGLHSCHGDEFERLYERYEKEGRAVRTVRARDLWGAILDAQIETGTPYLLYKDACNSKSNQRNLGTIQCSNLCTEIIQYTDEEEVAVCNLASMCLPKFVVSSRGMHGSIDPSSCKRPDAYFDHDALHEATKVVTRNLNKIIDVNQYPLDGARRSNLRHRPIGIGVSGLADAFIRLGLPFACDEARALNKAIFETIYHAALEASAELAERDGPYPTFQGSPASRGELQFNLWGLQDEDTPSHQQRRHLRQGPVGQKYGHPFRNGYDWSALRYRIMQNGVRNSLLVAPMPTASTSQILGVNECIEPFVSNLYLRRVKAGEFIMANPHLLRDLTDRGLWNERVRNQLMRDGGSVANIDCIPDNLKELYKTVWEIKMKDVVDMAADRGVFIDQSQSLNLFISDPTYDKLTAMHFYAWKKGLKTGMYYLRTRPAVNAIQYTVDKEGQEVDSESSAKLASLASQQDNGGCLSCQA